MSVSTAEASTSPLCKMLRFLDPTPDYPASTSPPDGKVLAGEEDNENRLAEADHIAEQPQPVGAPRYSYAQVRASRRASRVRRDVTDLEAKLLELQDAAIQSRLSARGNGDGTPFTSPSILLPRCSVSASQPPAQTRASPTVTCLNFTDTPGSSSSPQPAPLKSEPEAMASPESLPAATESATGPAAPMAVDVPPLRLPPPADLRPDRPRTNPLRGHPVAATMQKRPKPCPPTDLTAKRATPIDPARRPPPQGVPTRKRPREGDNEGVAPKSMYPARQPASNIPMKGKAPPAAKPKPKAAAGPSHRPSSRPAPPSVRAKPVSIREELHAMKAQNAALQQQMAAILMQLQRNGQQG